jgi:hypothetical protein
MGRKIVVITTIFGLTESVKAFSNLEDWHVVLVGDRNTPRLPRSPSAGVEFLSLEEQKGMGFELEVHLPVNHYSRKNVGYLKAIALGAEVIGDTDDDNAPLPRWGEELSSKGEYELVSEPAIVNVYEMFTEKRVWPRGFPLELVRGHPEIKSSGTWLDSVAVWQGLANGEPDVDAIFRLIFSSEIEFDMRPPVVLDHGVYAPVNSQNTIWFTDAYPYLYLPVTVSMRFTDILRGYVAQRGLHAIGSHVGFTQATVTQARNPHNPMSDFGSEIGCYQKSLRTIHLLKELDLRGDPATDLFLMYERLSEEGVVGPEELGAVEAWVGDLARLGQG